MHITGRHEDLPRNAAAAVSVAPLAAPSAFGLPAGGS
jgi:hypothetical protein